MKRKFTLLIAALALLTMIVQPGRVWGQTKTEQTASYGFETGDAGWTATNFVTNNTAITAHGGSKYGATNGGSTASVTYDSQVANPLSLTCYYSKTTTNTNAGSHFEIQVSTDNSTWTKVAEGNGMNNVTKGTWYELSADLSSYSNVYIRVYYTGTSAVRALDDITLTYDDGQTPSTDPEITFSPASISLEDVILGQDASATFTVSQANLTSDITLSVDNGSLSTSSITQGAEATSVTWNYTPSAAGDFSATVTATSGTTTQTLEITGNAIAPVEGYDVDFEYATNMYPNWTFANMESYQTGSITAHGGTYYGTTGGKATASITTTSTVENPGTLTCYVSKQTTNTSASTWYIQVSSDGNSWTDVETQDATSMGKGEWVEFYADLSSYSDVYVRVYYTGSTAVRNIDDLSLTTATPATVATPTFSPASGTEFGNEGLEVTISQADNKPIYYTLNGSEPTSSSTLYEAPFQITTTTTVKARAYDGENASNVATAIYTYVDPDAPGTQNNPYTVAQAIANTPSGGNVYIQGIVSAFYNTSIVGDGTNYRYYISDDGTTTSQLLVYKGKGLNQTTFTNADDLLVGDEVVIYGTLNTYNNAPQIAAGNYLYSWNRPSAPVATPTFNPEAGVYTEAQNVEISCETEGSTIYYTTDDTEPTNASTEYTGAISVTETTTIKAIAYVGEEYSSVATATYTIQAPLTTMDEIMAAANAAGTVATNVNITFGDWIVSGVGSNAKRAFVTDGTKGFIIYNNDGDLTFVKGDVLSGTKSCQVQLLNGAPCVKGLNASDFEITQTGQEPTVTTTTISALEAVNTGAVVDLGNLTWDGSKFVDNDNNSIYYYNTIYAGDVLTANTVYSVKGVYVQYSGNNPPKEIAPRDANDIVATPILATADVNIACDDTEGAITYTLANPVSGGTLTAAVTAGNEGNWLTLDEEIGVNVPFTCTANTATTARTATVTLTYTYYTTETVTATAVVTQAAVVPSITIATNTLEVTAESYTIVDDFLITYQNVIVENYESFDIQFYDANEEELQDEPDWLLIGVVGSNSEGYKVVGYIEANTGAARSAYFKVYAMDAETNLVYSNLVTINQEALVVDYATLPFEYEGGELSDFSELTGTSYVLTDQGSYATGNAPYRIKFTKTGDYLQVKTDSQPGIVTIGVKMIGGASTSYIYVQGSTDGATFDEGEALEISGKQNDILTLTSTRTFEENVRYVRLYFDKGSNVGVGPITIAKVDNTPSITINPGPYNLNSEGGNAELTVVYKNMPTDPQAVVIFYESDGETELTENPTWITATINANGNVDGHIDANDGDARSAYFKVKGIDANENPVYSALATINQAAYTLSIEFETTEVDIEAGGEQDRIISFDYQGLGENPTFEVRTYDVTGETQTTYDWLTTSITQGHKVSINVAENTGDARSAYFKVYGENGTVNTESNLVTINQAAAGVTYTLVETDDDIEPGLHYIIVGIGTDNKYYAMAEQRTNNRGEVLVTATGNTIAEVSGIHEFVISGDETNLYTIYDESDIVSSNVSSNGYLYAAGANSNNYLKTYPSVDNRGQWTININETTHKASIVANMTGRNTLRYNYGSGVFSCYTGGQQDIYLYKKNNDTDPVYYSPTIVNKDVEATAASPYIVQPYEILTGNITNTSGSANALIVKDGGEIVTTNNVLATYEKNITEPTAWYPDAAADGWYTISSPVGTVAINSVEGLTADPVGNVPQYDLFSYNEPNMMWYNAQGTAHSFTQLKVGMGYLYAKASISDPIGFKGNTNVNDVPLILTHEASGDMAGFNLIGNPFGQSITMDNIDGAEFSGGYVLTNNGTWKTTVDAKIKPCQGFMVQVDEGISIIINRVPSSKSRANHDYLAFTVSNSEFEDVTYAMFSNGIGLNKISHRNSQIPMVYIQQNNKDYAIATMDDNTQAFNLNFKAMTTGQYTLSFDAKGKYSYLHVIDRLTGEDIDMLLDGEYTFIGSPRDNENRFIVKLDYNANIDELEVSDSFVYQYGSDIIVNGNGELQVFDALGRMVMSTKVNGIQTVNVPATGMYIFRMVGESVQTQKIVVR